MGTNVDWVMLAVAVTSFIIGACYAWFAKKPEKECTAQEALSLLKMTSFAYYLHKRSDLKEATQPMYFVEQAYETAYRLAYRDHPEASFKEFKKHVENASARKKSNPRNNSEDTTERNAARNT